MTIISQPRNRKKKSSLCVAVFALAAFSFGQGQQRQALNQAGVPTPACQSTFSSLVQFTSPDSFDTSSHHVFCSAAVSLLRTGMMHVR